VFLSKGYTPYVFTGWNVTGSWEINVEYLGTNYPETLILAQTGTAITGISLNTNPPAAGSAFTIIDGSVVGDIINIVADHDAGSLVVHLTGTIAGDGSMSGTWWDIAPGTRPVTPVGMAFSQLLFRHLLLQPMSLAPVVGTLI
jgi:hypothetical protein